MPGLILESAATAMKRILLLISFVLALPALAQEWETVAPGVDYQRIVRDGLDAHVTRIDLTNPAIRVIATEASERGLTVTEFAKQNDAIVAINADYFDEQSRPLGLSMGACGVWTDGEPLQRKQGLVAVGNGRAEIQQNTMNVADWMTGAVSGWPLLNKDCEPLETLPGSDHFTRAPHPRTAAGLSSDGKTMYFVVADGRREGIPGPTLPELATFLDGIGACIAMNLDGGGSSAMWVGDRVRNIPSDGRERNVGNHLAVVAAGDYSGCDERKRKAKE
jgi:exopolysaccharide biosynthesis protein